VREYTPDELRAKFQLFSFGHGLRIQKVEVKSREAGGHRWVYLASRLAGWLAGGKLYLMGF